MRYTEAEKLEVIRLVERSQLSVRQTLAELGVPRSTFYRWYARYEEAGPEGLADRKTGPRQFWNRIPQAVRDQVVDRALGLAATRSGKWQLLPIFAAHVSPAPAPHGAASGSRPAPHGGVAYLGSETRSRQREASENFPGPAPAARDSQDVVVDEQQQKDNQDRATLRRLLIAAGVGRNSVKMAEFLAADLDLPTVRAHIAAREAALARGEAYGVGLLIVHLLSRDPAPTASACTCGRCAACRERVYGAYEGLIKR